jgi:lipoprotein-releasing system permease protein
MRLPFFIAKRYLISKKSHNLINVISIISVVGIGVGTLALIAVLSVFNGFEDVIKSIFKTVNPDLLITAKQGKTFHYEAFPHDTILQWEGIENLVPVVEEDALLQYGDKQYIAKMKGVSSEFKQVSLMDSVMIDGKFVLEEGAVDFAVLGSGVAWYLGVDPRDYRKLLSVYIPKRGNAGSFSMQNAFNNRLIHPAGVFSVQQDFDDRYFFVPLRFARDLMDYKDEVTSVEVYLKPGVPLKKIKKRMIALLDDSFKVLDRDEQNVTLLKVMRSEKLAVFLILVFIMVLASFNMIGSVSILIVEKKKDIGVLKSMGADKKMISRIFFNEGLLITAVGTISGLLLGFLILYLQQTFGLLKLGGGQGAFIIDAYPVKMVWQDFLYVLITVLLIGMAAAWYPVKYLLRNFEQISVK